MIHLDTNVLIALPLLARQTHPLIRRIARGQPVAVSALAWFEYLCGPVDDAEQQLALAAIGGRIVPLDELTAHHAAALFNAAGRRRQLRTDSLIAASAILNDAELFSFNFTDFEPFVPLGLRLSPLHLD